MANSSRVPAAIAGLKTKADALTARAFYGPNFTDRSIDEWIEIGIDDPELAGAGGLESARSQIDWAGLGAKSRDERITVSCAVTKWNGDGTEDGLQDAVEGAYAILAAFEALLVADPDIGNSVLYGGVSRTLLRPMQNEAGSMAYVLFDVECRARLSVF